MPVVITCPWLSNARGYQMPVDIKCPWISNARGYQMPVDIKCQVNVYTDVYIDMHIDVYRRGTVDARPHCMDALIYGCVQGKLECCVAARRRAMRLNARWECKCHAAADLMCHPCARCMHVDTTDVLGMPSPCALLDCRNCTGRAFRQSSWL